MQPYFPQNFCRFIIISWKDKNFLFFFIFGIYKPNLCHIAFSSRTLAKFSIWLLMEEENFLARKLLGFSNFLTIIFFPNFSLSIWSTFPIPSIKPNFKAVSPDQNSPVNTLFFSGSFNFFPLLFSTTFIKCPCSSSWSFFNLWTSSSFSSTKGSSVLLFFPAV